MTLDIWLAFVLTTTTILILPGPTVILVIGYAINLGRSSAWATIPGVLLGDFTAMTASLLGAGAVLMASASLFTILKMVGAAYLIWLGIKLWRSSVSPITVTAQKETTTSKKMFVNAFIVTALNPKSLVFFVAFVPQFINPAKPAFAQFAILEATFLVLVAVIVTGWAMLASILRKKMSSEKNMRRTQKISGSFLIGAGAMTASMSRLN